MVCDTGEVWDAVFVIDTNWSAVHVVLQTGYHFIRLQARGPSVFNPHNC